MEFRKARLSAVLLLGAGSVLTTVSLAVGESTLSLILWGVAVVAGLAALVVVLMADRAQ